jgi:UDP-N-acetylmuramyl pentapeptide phosphotransferase/UDP-N-acetylglucosamine-1-phosphate transferase
MARGDHPMRTPAYGGLLIAVAMVGATVAVRRGSGWPGWVEPVIVVVAVVACLTGALLTLRDRTPPRRPGPRP